MEQTHFLALARPNILVSVPEGRPDTTTLAAHDFDVDTRTGFMPPQLPTSSLPQFWSQWEIVLDDAILHGLQLGDRVSLSDCEKRKSEAWRNRVRKVSTVYMCPRVFEIFEMVCKATNSSD